MDQEKSLGSYFCDSLSSEEGFSGSSSSMANGGSGVIGGGDSHQSDENGGDGSKKPIWKKPIVEIGDVMACDSWPALSESVHLKSKSSSTNSLKALLNIPPSVSQGSSSMSSSSKHVVPTRQKSINLDGGGVGSSGHGGKQANGSLSQAPLTKGVVVEASNPGKSRSSVTESSRVNMRMDVGHRATSYGTNGVLSQVSLKQVLVDEASPSNSVNSVASVGQSSRENAHKDVWNQGGSYAGNGILSQAPPALGVVVEASSSNLGKSVAGESSKANAYNNFGPRRGSYLGNGQHNQQRPSYRRSNSGPLMRGDGSYTHSYGSKRDQERRNLNWNQNRSFNSRGNHGFQHRDGSRPLFQGLSPNVPFIPQAPVPIQHFMNPYMYTGMPPSVFVVPGNHPGYPFVPIVPYSPTFVPMPDSKLPSEVVRPNPELPSETVSPDPKLPSEVELPSTSSPDPELLSKIIRQINHYFSEENLVKDWYLKRYMDNEGWVSVTLIAGFNRVRRLTDNVQLILDALHASDVVEVQGDKVRRRNDWVRWLQLPFQNPTPENKQSVDNYRQDSVGANFGNLSLDGRPSI